MRNDLKEWKINQPLHFWESEDGLGVWRIFDRYESKYHNIEKCCRMGGGCIKEEERRNFSDKIYAEGIVKQPGNWVSITDKVLPTRNPLPLLFMDAEFCNIEAKEIKFLSISFVKENGENIYIEFYREEEEYSEWVKKYILPLLWYNESGFYRDKDDQAKNKIISFLNNKKYQMVADVNQFDWIAWCNFWGGVFKQPLHYIPLDLATKLAIKGFDPDCNRKSLAHNLGIQIDGEKHNALYDAKICRALWMAL